MLFQIAEQHHMRRGEQKSSFFNRTFNFNMRRGEQKTSYFTLKS